MLIHIEKMRVEDIDAVALVHSTCFKRQQLSTEWIRCNHASYPRMQLYVARNVHRELVGYIQWTQKSGFRKEVVLELEQLAVYPEHQRQGIGHQLITESLPLVQRQLQSRGASVNHILVTTRADNDAQKLYKKALNAEVEASISNLYSGEEVVMVARNVFGGTTI